MPPVVVVIGIGQIGGVFAQGFLRGSNPVFPITRGTDPAETAVLVPDAQMVLVAVGEDDLEAVLEGMHPPWRKRVGLVQNELMPDDWVRHGIADPTVAVVWFEKKAGRPAKVIQSTPVAGPAAQLCVSALSAVGLDAHEIRGQPALLLELAAKSLYILVSNLTGLEVGGTVGELWERHRSLAESVASDVHAVLSARAEWDLPFDQLISRVANSFSADPDHAATGRSAPRRLARTLEHADRHGLAVPELRRLERVVVDGLT